MPTNFSMLFEHTYSKFSENLVAIALTGFFPRPFCATWSMVLEAIKRYYSASFTLVFKSRRSLWGHVWCNKNYFLSIFKGIWMNFLLELIFFYSKTPSDVKIASKIVQRLMGHLLWATLYIFICNENAFIYNCHCKYNF